MQFSSADERWMRRALELARRGAGLTSPNPMVGAVIVRNGKLIGEGFHQRAGGPHAEIVALRSAQRSNASTLLRSAVNTLRRATLYVTLEPCCTHGRTPPCTDAIIASGIKRVVVATLDPNPKHSGRGIQILRRAGIRVETGLLREKATQLNKPFNKWITTGMPWVTVKAAMSLDGKIATYTGDSRWITAKPARKLVHQMRAAADAVMVGSRTVVRDDPALTARLVRAKKQPWRIVVDSQGKTPLSARVYSDSFRHNTIVLTTKSAGKNWRTTLEQRGVRVLLLPSRGGKIDLRAALSELGRLEIADLLVEGGGELIGALFDARLVDKLVFFYSPKIIGGRNAANSVGGTGALNISAAQTLENLSVEQVGKDLLVTADCKR
jgi:diaminohydroxyphosphoribosylaminopyrimidine deaminase/5-amino-6-(5-phosphoribosylamino)uracil reductase